jgi:hypothetical protein
LNLYIYVIIYSVYVCIRSFCSTHQALDANDENVSVGDIAAEPSIGDVSNITGIGGNTMSKIPGTGVRPGSALREGGAIGVRPGSATATGTGAPTVPGLNLGPSQLPPLGVQVPNTNGANVTFAAAPGVDVSTLRGVGTDINADPLGRPPPLKKRVRKATKAALKAAGSYTRAFFRGIRKGVRFTYGVVVTHGPVIAGKAYIGSCAIAFSSYIFIRDNTVGAPIKPKNFIPVPKGQHWNTIPKVNKRPKIIPEMSKAEARRASLSAKTLKLQQLQEEEDALDDDFDHETEGKKRGGRRGSTDSGMVSVDSAATEDTEDSGEELHKKGARKRTRRKKGLLVRVFKAVFETIFGRPPPKETLMEKRAREKEKQEGVS